MMWYMVYKRARLMRAWVGGGSEVKDILMGMYVYNLTVGMDLRETKCLNRLNRMMKMGEGLVSSICIM